MTLVLKTRLKRNSILLAPGVYDPLTASLAADAGFEALYLSGAAIAYTKLGRPDIGLVTMSEVVDTIALIRDRVTTPLIVDADNGYGNALNMQRTMRLFERAGANALQIEDQSYPKRCGHLAEKRLISPLEMAGKIRAAADARADAETLIIARTDAIAVEGFTAAIDRAGLYAEAGADALFVEAPGNAAELSAIVKSLRGGLPLMANMVEGGRTPVLPAARLKDIGYSFAIFPGTGFLAMGAALQRVYQSLRDTGTTSAAGVPLYDFMEFSKLMGFEDVWAFDKRYAED
jgi:2-methylisocitrate lyase-like PEP mutase family enzyme